MDEALALEFERIRWFASAGQEHSIALPFPLIQVSSCAEAIEMCSAPAWDDVTLEARNRLTEYLHLRHRERYQQWNDITDEAKTRIVTPLAERVWQPFARLHGLGKVFIDCLSWDVLAAIMEHEYRDCSGRPIFFQHLIDVYRAGHFPCGWRGEWPGGLLLAY
jgi:hypothetical protein